MVLWRQGADEVRKGRPRSLPPEDRALLVATYWPTNLTMRELAPLFEVLKSVGGPDRRPSRADARAPAPQAIRQDTVVIADGTLVPTRDHTIAERSKNRRYSTNHHVVIEAGTRLVVVVGRPSAGPGRAGP